MSNSQPSVSKSIRLPFQQWEKVEHLVEDKIFPDFSSAVRMLVDGGLRLLEIKDKVQNPEEIKRLSSEWGVKMNEKQVLEWAYSLSDSQLQAVDMLVDLEKERRYKP